jgi:hyperosmotically inducible protein
MKKLMLGTVVVLSPLFLAANAMANEPYVKDSVISAKVKTKLAEKHISNVKVDTDADGVVWLSGKAPTQDASDIATRVAEDTEGVRAIHNKIVIAP